MKSAEQVEAALAIYHGYIRIGFPKEEAFQMQKMTMKIYLEIEADSNSMEKVLWKEIIANYRPEREQNENLIH